MARFKIQGFISFQLLLSMLLMQLSFLMIWPNIKEMLLNWQARIYLNQIQFDINAIRLRSMMEHKTLYLYPLSLLHNWALGWRVSADKQILWQKKPYAFFKVDIEWHGFKQHPPLTFYPDLLKNHVNGYFKARGYRLWLNRLGYSRISYEL